MKLLQKVKEKLEDPLKTFKWFEFSTAITCITVPGILRLTDTLPTGKPATSFRPSISDYVYMPHSYVFGLLLMMAAMLFIFNGAVYFKNQNKPQLILDKSGKWYNVALGLSLVGVIIFPCHQYVTTHLIFAILFFVGNAVVTGLFYQKRNKVVSILLAILTLATLVPVKLNVFSLFWGEWLSLTVIGIHFILESRGDVGQRVK
jgi:hypothetical protein